MEQKLLETKKVINKQIISGISFLFFIFAMANISAQDVTLKINLRGVVESKITLLSLIGPNALKPIAERAGIRNSETAILTVSKDMLPSEFVVRFDYKAKETDTPYPSEKHIFISNQNLELWANPLFCNNGDSTYFQKDEKENTLFARFTKENDKQKQKVSLLQNFLMSYDDIHSKFYQQGIEEYEKRRDAYNQWLTEQSAQHAALFVSHTFRFQYMPQITFKGNETDRVKSVIAHYFDGMDFKDTLLLRTTNLKEWINNYVNLFAVLSVNENLRDSLFALAGKTAIEKASKGNPKIYGWMVDYFYVGYETFGMKKGMAMLQQFINDPNCLTLKKQQINKRLDGMAKLIAGTKAPDFILGNSDGSDFDFHTYKGNAKYKLLLFWSADCEHCQALVKEIKPWYDEINNKTRLDIIAVSLDNTETEMQKWENTIINLPGWKHFRAKGGVNSIVANDYFILSTPVMFLIESESNLIRDTPTNLEQLKKELEK